VCSLLRQAGQGWLCPEQMAVHPLGASRLDKPRSSGLVQDSYLGFTCTLTDHVRQQRASTQDSSMPWHLHVLVSCMRCGSSNMLCDALCCRGHASENPELPEALNAKGIRFLGPPGKAMAALGDKVGHSDSPHRRIGPLAQPSSPLQAAARAAV